MGTTTKDRPTTRARIAAHNGHVARMDETQRELLASPELVHITIRGESVPFLLSIDGLERAEKAGHDPLPALGRLFERLFSDGGSSLADIDIEDKDAVAAAIKGRLSGGTLSKVLTTSTLVDLLPLLYAGVVSFDRGLSFDVFKARVTLPVVFSVLVNALPQLASFVSTLDLSGVAQPAGDGDEGN